MGWNSKMELVKIFGGSLGLSSNKGFSSRLLDFATNSKYIPTFEISKENIDKVLDLIMGLKQPVLIGYASSLFNLSIYVKYSKKYRIENISKKVNLVITTSELLPDSWKNSIESVFNCRVKSYYGCGEVNGIAYQLKESNDYFVFNEHVLLETNQNCKNENELLITQLFNKARPLIRYQNGDLCELIEVNGRTHIKELIGRTADMLQKKDGSKISSIFGTYSIQKAGIPVERYQYIQQGFNDFDFIYNPINQDISEVEKQTLIKMLANVMNSEEVRLSFIKNGDFEISSNGKHRIIISKIK